jgi:PE-PGRS C-terminal aspartyl peptidase-like domain
MAGLDGTNGNKRSRNAKVRRRRVVVIGGAVGAFVAAAAMATGSAVTAAPAKADFEDLLDPIIQPILTSLTDSFAGFDPAAAVDVTSWTDSLFASLNSIDLALPSTAESAAAVAASANPAADPANATIPLTVLEDTEPAVNATVAGGSSVPLLVDTGSSGLVIPYTDLGSTTTQQLTDLFDLGVPTGFGESGFSGGVDYLYLTYDNVPVDYAGGLDTTAPVEVEVFSWPTSLSSSTEFQELFSNTAFQDFLSSNDVNGILGIGDNVSGGAGESPLEAAGYDGVLVNIPGHDLIVSDTNPGTAIDTLPNSGATPTTDLTETVTNSAGQQVGTGSVSDDVDSGGVYGTIPSTISSSTLAQGDTVAVYDGTKELYSYVVGTDSLNQSESPIVVSGSSIDSGVEPFEQEPIFIDYANHTLSFDDTLQ